MHCWGAPVSPGTCQGDAPCDLLLMDAALVTWPDSRRQEAAS